MNVVGKTQLFPHIVTGQPVLLILKLAGGDS